MWEGKLHFGKEVWTWSANSGQVFVRDPNRMKTVLKSHEVWKHWHSYSEEKKLPTPEHAYSDDFGINITPCMVKAYIERHLLPVKKRG